MVKNAPKYSIIIPVYNAEDNINGICQKILSQKYKDLELILVDDGSTDKGLENMKRFARSDSRVRVVSQPNQGPSAARNTGIKVSTGEYIIFCDADDSIIESNFEKILKKFETSTLDMIVFGWWSSDALDNRSLFSIMSSQRIEGNDNIISKTIKSIGEDGRMYNLWNKIFKASVIREHNLKFNTDLKFGEDLLFIFSYLGRSNSVFFSKNNPYYVYVVDSKDSLVSSSKLKLDYRVQNDKGLIDFYESTYDKTLAGKAYLEYVRLRWRISFYLGVASARIGWQDRIKLAYGYKKAIKIKFTFGYLKFYRASHKIVFLLGSLISVFPVVFLLLMKIISLPLRKSRKATRENKLSLV